MRSLVSSGQDMGGLFKTRYRHAVSVYGEATGEADTAQVFNGIRHDTCEPDTVQLMNADEMAPGSHPRLILVRLSETKPCDTKIY